MGQAAAEQVLSTGNALVGNAVLNTSGQYENGLIVQNGNLLVPNGKIGVRTLTPLADLDVVGTTLLRGKVSVGGTSDPSGLANALTVAGKVSATEGLCIGTTCMSETQLQTALAGGGGGGPTPTGDQCFSFGLTGTNIAPGNTCSPSDKAVVLRDCCQTYGTSASVNTCTLTRAGNHPGGGIAVYTGTNCGAQAPVLHLRASVTGRTDVPIAQAAPYMSGWMGTEGAVGSTCNGENVWFDNPVNPPAYTGTPGGPNDPCYKYNQVYYYGQCVLATEHIQACN
jgi:hypothetical protein